MIKIPSQNSKTFGSFCQEKRKEIQPFSKEVRLTQIGHKISMVIDTRKSYSGS